MLPFTLRVNCGFARVALVRSSEDDFKSLFQAPLKLEDSYFQRKSDGRTCSSYETRVKAMRNMFSKRWHPQSQKSEYEGTFAVDTWKSLTVQEREHHNLQQCKQCYTGFYNHQSIFPAMPIYMATSEVIIINKPAEMREKSFIKVAVESLNKVCQKEFNHNFIDSLVSCQPGIEQQKTKSEKKAERRKIMKQCRDACNKELEITTPVTLLRENESLSGYARKRLSQYFEKPPSAKRQQKSHAPSFANVKWNKQKKQLLRKKSNMDKICN